MKFPSFGEPRLTVPIEDALAESGLSVTEHEPLPRIFEPQFGRVTEPVDDPLVAVAHPRIVVLANYLEAGWPSATDSCLCRSIVLDALGRAVETLPDRFGLAVFDAWRPLALQIELHLAATASDNIGDWLVAEPDTDPTAPPPHLSGGAIDLTLTIDGRPLELGAGFDDTTPLAHAAAFEHVPGPARDGRRMLYWAMRSAGFIVYSEEWWHYELGTRRWAAVTGGEALFAATTPGGASA